MRQGGATPLPDIKVKIRGEDNEVVSAVTDKAGEFHVKKLKAGRYTVEPEFPANYTSERKYLEVIVDDRGTASVGFEAYINGKVLGRVADKDGTSFNSIFLHLEADGKSIYGHSTKQNGGFSFNGVPPGSYVLYLELRASDYNKNTKYYYPGTFKAEEARAIKVGLGEIVEGINFVLPGDYKVRAIEGQVVWEDGTPAAFVEVMLLCPQSAAADGLAVEFSPTVTLTGGEGKFRLEGFTGEVYWIEARGAKAGGESDGERLHSPPKRIAVNENLKNLKLVLSEKGFGAGCEK